MKTGVYAIYDEASEAFLQYTSLQNDKMAEMTFTKLFKDKRINIPMIYDYPNVYKVYKLATFDDNTGIFENLPQHIFVLDFGAIEVKTDSSISS